MSVENSETESVGVGTRSILWLFFILVLILGVLSFFAILGAALVTIGTVGFWPTMQDFLDNRLIRFGVTISFVAAGFVFYHWRQLQPRVFALVEVAFALALAYVALGSKDADRMTIALAIIATAFIVANGVQLWMQTRVQPKLDEATFRLEKSGISFYKGKEFVERFPYRLGTSSVFKIDFNKLVARVEKLEER